MKANFSKVNSNFNEQSNDFNCRFDTNDEKFESRFNSNDDLLRKMHSDINKQKIKCEQQNIKNDINFQELKEQNIKFEQNINVMFDNLIKQTKDDVDNVTRNTGKCSGLSLIHI